MTHIQRQERKLVSAALRCILSIVSRSHFRIKEKIAIEFSKESSRSAEAGLWMMQRIDSRGEGQWSKDRIRSFLCVGNMHYGITSEDILILEYCSRRIVRLNDPSLHTQILEEEGIS